MPTHRRKRKDLTRSTWAIRARKTLDIASDIAADVIKLRDKPGILDFASLGTRLANKVVNSMEGEIYDFFDEWHDISDIVFRDELMTSIRKFDTDQVGGHETYAIMVTDVYGEEVGWVRTSPEPGADGGKRSSKLPTYEGPWINFERYDETFQALGRAMWEHLDSSKVVLGARSKLRYDSHEINTKLGPDFEIDNDVFPSKHGVELFERIKKFYDANINRSVILLGPPGTGKTTIMKYIARCFDKHTMRINVSELAAMPSESVVAAVQLLKPEVLLIDDFDRFGAHQNGMILSQLEQVNRAVRVFIVSANNICDLDPAVIRAGRFDEIIEISDIDPGVVERIISDLPEQVRDTLATWPVAYISEFAKRYKVLGPDVALREVAELRYRIEKINNSAYRGFEFGDDGLNDALDGWGVKGITNGLSVGKTSNKLQSTDWLDEEHLEELISSLNGELDDE